MTDRDILLALKESIREELSERADELIEDLCRAFRDQLNQNKHILITKMLDEIEILAMENSQARELVFQINLKGGNNNGRERRL